MADDQDKHLERLIQLYENKSKNFEKYFAILLGISLFIFFFMLFPYVYLQIMEKNLIKQVDRNNEELDKKISEISILNETKERIVTGNLTFNTQLINLSNEFKEYYVYLTSHTSNDNITQNNLITLANECEMAYNTTEWIYCNLNHKSINMKNIINETLYQEIIFPIEQSNIFISSEIKKALSNIIEKIQDELYNLNFIISSTNSDGSENSVVTQINNINSEFKKIYQVIDNKIIELDNEIKAINKKALDLKKKLDNLQQKRKEILDLLNDFESPIGKLTVGFDHVILIFPLILLGGFVFCLSILIDANAIRKILLKNYKVSPQSNNVAIKNEDIFPIFMDKINSIKVLVLFIPLIIFVISCIVIVLSWATSTESTFGYDEIYRYIFLILYISFGIIVSVISILQLKDYGETSIKN